MSVWSSSADTYDAEPLKPAESCLELDAIDPGITEMLAAVTLGDTKVGRRVRT